MRHSRSQSWAIRSREVLHPNSAWKPWLYLSQDKWRPHPPVPLYTSRLDSRPFDAVSVVWSSKHEVYELYRQSADETLLTLSMFITCVSYNGNRGSCGVRSQSDNDRQFFERTHSKVGQEKQSSIKNDCPICFVCYHHNFTTVILLTVCVQLIVVDFVIVATRLYQHLLRKVRDTNFTPVAATRLLWRLLAALLSPFVNFVSANSLSHTYIRFSWGFLFGK